MKEQRYTLIQGGEYTSDVFLCPIENKAEAIRLFTNYCLLEDPFNFTVPDWLVHLGPISDLRLTFTDPHWW